MSIEVNDSLHPDGTVSLTCTDARFDETDVWLDEEQAMQLICDLVKVLHVPESTIEVIHFPMKCNRADVLRAAADRIDAGEVFDGTY